MNYLESEISKDYIEELYSFLRDNLNQYTSIPVNIINITDNSYLTNDPGNELLLMVHINPTDDNLIYSDHEPLINIRALSNHLQNLNIANGDHCLTVEPYIGMNSTVLLPITLLK